MRNRIDEKRYAEIGEELGIPPREVKRAVESFFSVIVHDASVLPFNNPTKIFSHSAFMDYGVVCNIPKLGRIGPTYSRYLKWRANEAKAYQMENRDKVTKSRYSREDVEKFATQLLGGKTDVIFTEKDILTPMSKAEMLKGYNRVWWIDDDKKSLARQVIKTNKRK